MTEKAKILGAPGCGKTFSLMKQFDTLLQSSGYTPDDITLITFRKSSAEDLISSVTGKLHAGVPAVKKHVGTIHSICWRLGGYREVMSRQDYSNFIKEYKYGPFMSISAIKDEEEAAYSGDLFDLYTWIRNTDTKPEKWMRYPGADNVKLPGNRVPEFLSDYEKYKEKIGKIDYSDMLQNVIDEHIDLDTPVLMVDEFQDLTAQMYKLFNMWAVNREVVTIAGDPFQSIYGFWGGSPDYFNNWKADEKILGETHRLPEQIKQFGRKILKYGGMTAPDPTAKAGYVRPIIALNYGQVLPSHKSELHLIRCNYQAGAVAFDLATSGKVFGGIKGIGWSGDEILLANSIITYRMGRALTKDMIKSVINAYPAKLFGGKANRDDVLNRIDKSYTPELNTGNGVINNVVLDSMASDDPTIKMGVKNKLFTEKIKGILKRTSPIMTYEMNNRKVLTIHGSKGLEADAVFLHTAITPKIWKNTVIPGSEHSAESRVWYVGATRARENLYLIKDIGRNWTMPGVIA